MVKPRILKINWWVLSIAIAVGIAWACSPVVGSPPGTFPDFEIAQSDLIWRFLSILALIAINGFFVAAEFSVVSVRRSRIDQLVDEGDAQAKAVQDLQRSLDRLLSTTQIGITLSSLALGWIGEKTMAVCVAAIAQKLPLSLDSVKIFAYSIAIPLAFLLVAYLQIVLGELCPKSVALLYPEELARILAPYSLAISRLFNPFLWILNQSTRLLLRLAGIRYTPQSWFDRVTPEELQLIIATEGESAGLEAEERELLNNVFEFRDVSVEEVMIPRTSLHAIPHTATLRMLLNEVANSGHSRYPTIGESLDDVRGIIHYKDLADPMAKGSLTLDSSIRPWVRPARFVPEYTLLSELLAMMRRSQQPMMMVVDEFGGTAGMVTFQDLVSEILGDEHEPEEAQAERIRMLDEQTAMVQAQTDLEEVNDFLSLNLPLTDEYQTLGGFLIYQMQKIPIVGDTWQYDNLEFTIISTEGPRLHQIQVRRLESASAIELTTQTSSECQSLSPEEDDLNLFPPFEI
jgi:CBS domain containing-hemolysin-like protein